LQSKANSFNIGQCSALESEGCWLVFEVLTLDEAAKRARISRRQLNYQIAAGRGPAVTRIGHAVRVRSDAFEEWLDRCTARPPRDAKWGAVAAA